VSALARVRLPPVNNVGVVGPRGVVAAVALVIVPLQVTVRITRRLFSRVRIHVPRIRPIVITTAVRITPVMPAEIRPIFARMRLNPNLSLCYGKPAKHKSEDKKTNFSHLFTPRRSVTRRLLSNCCAPMCCQ
jgi:hypothetical protein